MLDETQIKNLQEHSHPQSRSHHYTTEDSQVEPKRPTESHKVQPLCCSLQSSPLPQPKKETKLETQSTWNSLGIEKDRTSAHYLEAESSGS